MKDKPVILIVDDLPQNLELLEAHLGRLGYEIVKAASGEEALVKLSGNQIDLVLLDVMMPGMNGYDVCRILKRKKDYLPVIMLTSLDDRDSRIRGIESGADDFISKPFDSTELKLKIKNILKTKFLYDKVENNYREMKTLDELKDSLTSFIIHDLRNPLAVIDGYLHLVLASNKLEEQEFAKVQKAKQSAKTMISMIANLLDMLKMENNEMAINAEDCELAEIISDAIREVEHLLNKNNIHLVNKISETNTTVKAQRDMISRVTQNLLANAIRYTPEQGNILIECEPDENPVFVVTSVSDSGTGIPKEYQQKIFDKFATVEEKQERIRGSTGLGLAFCKLAVEIHGGKIWVEDRNGGGSIFRFTLPLSSAKR